jgi:hypothetical protein
MKAKAFEPIRILGVIAAEVGVPRNDGTAGSGLYKVPFQLSRKPLELWANLFVDAWDRPSKFTSMHRPGIARVEGDRIVLDGTTIEEVEKYHLRVLKTAILKANEQTSLFLRRRALSTNFERNRGVQHRRHVSEVAKRLRFE